MRKAERARYETYLFSFLLIQVLCFCRVILCFFGFHPDYFPFRALNFFTFFPWRVALPSGTFHLHPLMATFTTRVFGYPLRSTKTLVSGVSVSHSGSSLHPSSSFRLVAFHEASLVTSCSSCIFLGDSGLVHRARLTNKNSLGPSELKVSNIAQPFFIPCFLQDSSEINIRIVWAQQRFQFFNFHLQTFIFFQVLFRSCNNCPVTRTPSLLLHLEMPLAPLQTMTTNFAVALAASCSFQIAEALSLASLRTSSLPALLSKSEHAFWRKKRTAVPQIANQSKTKNHHKTQ